MLFIEKGEIDVLDGAFVVIDKTGVRTHIPVGSVACLMLEPGTRVSHWAAALAARVVDVLEPQKKTTYVWNAVCSPSANHMGLSARWTW